MAKQLIFKDPLVFRKSRPELEPNERLVLALDLGTTTGYAIAKIDPAEPIDIETLPVYIGQWDLSAGQYDSGAIRFVKLEKFLHAVQPDLVVYERIRNTPPMKVTKYNAAKLMGRATTAAQFFGALMGTVSRWCERRQVPCTGVEIAHIKKRATGKGNASKEDMVKAMNEQFGTDFDPTTYEQTGVDNICDAAFCLLLAIEEFANGLGDPARVHAGSRSAGPATEGL